MRVWIHTPRNIWLLFGVVLCGLSLTALVLRPHLAYAQTDIQQQLSIPEPAARSVPEGVFYMTGSSNSLDSFRANVNTIDIVAPQIYSAKPDGTLLGHPIKEVSVLSKFAGTKVMPLVTNQRFSQEGAHALLVDDKAQDKLIAALVRESLTQGYIGFQYDFENMRVTDRNRFSLFVEKSAGAFHAAGLQLSVAMSPRHSDLPSDYSKGSWDNWAGAFDYDAIGNAVDFVSIMAYDGPTTAAASLPWVQDVVAYTLQHVPAEKVSLGVPFYFLGWADNSGKKTNVGGYGTIFTIMNSKSYKKKGWSEDLGVSWIKYIKNGTYFTAWYEDKRSFEQKMQVVQDNKLRGFSAWALGQEDPKIWDVILALRSPFSTQNLAFLPSRNSRMLY